MTHLRIPALLAALMLFTACAEQESHEGTPSLEALRGQWVLVNYWAQWCKPCIEEIPELNALDKKYDDVSVLGVNYDGATGADLGQQLEILGVAFPTLANDPSEQLGTTRPVVLPTTFIVDKDGKLADTLLGPQTLETLEQAIGRGPLE